MVLIPFSLAICFEASSFWIIISTILTLIICISLFAVINQHTKGLIQKIENKNYRISECYERIPGKFSETSDTTYSLVDKKLKREIYIAIDFGNERKLLINR